MKLRISSQLIIKCAILFFVSILLCLFGNKITDIRTISAVVMLDVVLVQIALFRTDRVLSVYYIFLSTIALFHFSQCLLYVFDVPVNLSYGYDVLRYYSVDTLIPVLIWSTVIYNMLGIGGLVGEYNNISYNTKKEFDEIELTRVYYFGKILFFFLIIPILYYDFTLLRSGIAIGYRAKTTYSSTFLTAIDSYFPFSIICLFTGQIIRKNWKPYYYFAIVRLALQMFLVGNRGPLMIVLIMYQLSRRVFSSRTEQKISRKGKILIGIYVIIVCIGLSYVAVIRGGKRISFSTFIKDYNVFSLFFSEFGSTLITPILAYNYIVDYGMQLGKTYFGAIAVFLPFSTNYMSDIRSFGNIASILNKFSPSGGALGGSFVADIIMNFGTGIIGAILALIFGVLIMKISEKVRTADSSVIIICLLLFVSTGIVWYSRGSAQELVLSIKRAIYMGLLYFLYTQFIGNKKYREDYKSGI